MIDDTAVIKSIKQKRVFQVTDLAEWLHCSLPTCRRRLKQWQAHTSYNHNGRYYTLPDIPVFDAHGIWHYRDISFSRHGNLKKTVAYLVRDSAHGLSAAEIGEILRMNPHSFLPHFQNVPGLYREKIGGRFIWFTADTAIGKQQKRARLELIRSELIAMPSDREAVIILVDLLHHSNASIREIARRLKRKGATLKSEVIHDFLAHHNLLKKTTDPNSCAV